MLVDNWKYYDADDYMICVNDFQDDEKTPMQQNVYVALNKDINEKGSVHDVMKLVEEMN
tara:strand:- start:725 stop:901 length:177 start_codon:yes stop_codon:yes gene_type:complete